MEGYNGDEPEVLKQSDVLQIQYMFIRRLNALLVDRANTVQYRVGISEKSALNFIILAAYL